MVKACILLAFFRVFELYKIATLPQHVYIIELPRPWHQNNALECGLSMENARIAITRDVEG